MKHTLNRLTALLLAMAMCLAMAAVPAFAEEVEEVEAPAAVEVAEETEAAEEEAPAEEAEPEAEAPVEEAEAPAEEVTTEAAPEEDKMEAEASGKIGTVNWEYASGTLTLSGTGDTGDFEFDFNTWATTAPWGKYASRIKKAVIKKGITRIGNYAFFYCYNMTSVSFPSTLKSIGSSAFSEANSLESFTLPEGLTTIGDQAFWGAAETVKIPSTVTKIGNNAFSFMHNLVSISVASGNTKFCTSGGVLYNKAKTRLLCYPCCKTNTKYTIPDTVTTLDPSAFYSAAKLTSVTIPKSVAKIPDFCFAYTGLTSVTINNGLTSIGEQAFESTPIKSVTIPKSVTKISPNAFFFCEQLSSVTLNEGLQSIGKGAFDGCPKLKTITVPASVTKIGRFAYGYDCVCDKIKGFTVNGYKGTAAETHASENNFKFVNRVAKPAISVLIGMNDSITAQWDAVDNVTKYQVQFSTSSDFATKTTVTTADTSATATGLTKGKTYYVRVRAYKSINSVKYYSSWSTKVSTTLSK